MLTREDRKKLAQRLMDTDPNEPIIIETDASQDVTEPHAHDPMTVSAGDIVNELYSQNPMLVENLSQKILIQRLTTENKALMSALEQCKDAANEY